MLPRGVVKARGGHPAARPLASIVLARKGAARRWRARGRAVVLQSAEVRPPNLSSGAAARAGAAGRSTQEWRITQCYDALLVCALAALCRRGGHARRPPPPRRRSRTPKAEQKPKKQEEPPKPRQGRQDNPTAEQVAETVVLVYGSRAGLAQIRRTGVERGTHHAHGQDGRTEEITYERTFKRGETYEKDKIRLDQRLSVPRILARLQRRARDAASCAGRPSRRSRRT